MTTNNNKTLEELLEIISTGTASEIKEAKKSIDKKWSKDTEDFNKSAELIFNYIKTFDLINNPINKAGVISAMRLFYLALADEHFVPLKDFIIKNLQHSDGRIREAARNTGEWLYCSLDERASPFVYPEGKELTIKQKKDQIIAEKQYIDFVREVESLIEKYDDGKEEVEYISYMKPSIHKSLQQVWGRLTDGPTYREIILKTNPVPLEISIKRKEIESKIKELLNMEKIDEAIALDYIKEIIYEEDSVKDMRKLFEIFDKVPNVELDEVIKVIGDAWNYFPHKSLDGKCPSEMYPVNC